MNEQIQFRPVGLEIIVKGSIKDLEVEVSRRLESGEWMLHGDWSVVPDSTGVMPIQFAQAMARMGFRTFKVPEGISNQTGQPLIR